MSKREAREYLVTITTKRRARVNQIVDKMIDGKTINQRMIDRRKRMVELIKKMENHHKESHDWFDDNWLKSFEKMGEELRSGIVDMMDDTLGYRYMASDIYDVLDEMGKREFHTYGNHVLYSSLILSGIVWYAADPVERFLSDNPHQEYLLSRWRALCAPIRLFKKSSFRVSTESPDCMRHASKNITGPIVHSYACPLKIRLDGDSDENPMTDSQREYIETRLMFPKKENKWFWNLKGYTPSLISKPVASAIIGALLEGEKVKIIPMEKK